MKNKFEKELKRIFGSVNNSLQKNSNNSIDQFVKISIVARALISNLHANKESVFGLIDGKEMPLEVQKDWEEIKRLLTVTEEWSEGEKEHA